MALKANTFALRNQLNQSLAANKRFGKNFLPSLATKGTLTNWLGQQQIGNLTLSQLDTAVSLKNELVALTTTDTHLEELQEELRNSGPKDAKKIINKIFKVAMYETAAAQMLGLGHAGADLKHLSKMRKMSVDPVQRAVIQVQKKKTDKLILDAKKEYAKDLGFDVAKVWVSGGTGEKSGLVGWEFKKDDEVDFSLSDAAAEVERKRKEAKKRFAKRGETMPANVTQKYNDFYNYFNDPQNQDKLRVPTAFNPRKSRLTEAGEWTDPSNPYHIDYNPLELARTFIGPEYAREHYFKYIDANNKMKRLPRWAQDDEDNVYAGKDDEYYLMHMQGKDIKNAVRLMLVKFLGPDTANRIKVDNELV